MTYRKLWKFVKFISAHPVLPVSLPVHTPVTVVQTEWICATDSAGEAF